MTTYRIEYPLCDGYVHNWLVAGPHASDAPGLHAPGREPEIPSLRPGNQPPEERESVAVDGETLDWYAVRCEEDHLLDLAGHYAPHTYLRAWAYVELVAPTTQEATLTLTACASVDLWLNAEHLHRHEPASRRALESVSCPCVLHEGTNQVVVRLEKAHREGDPYAAALRVDAADLGAFAARVPCYNEQVDRRLRNERMVDAAYIDRDLYAEDEELAVRWPEDLGDKLKMTVRVQKPTGQIYAEARPDVQAGSEQKMLRAYELNTGFYHVRVMTDVLEYYMGDVHVARELGVYMIRQAHVDGEVGAVSERATAVLRYAAQLQAGIFGEIAKMALNMWSHVDEEALRAAIERVNGQHGEWAADLLGLLVILARYARRPAFPARLVEPIEACVTGASLGRATGKGVTCWPGDITFQLYAGQILAGQLYPDRTWPGSGLSGRQLREAGEAHALAWLVRRGSSGFPEWDAGQYFERSLLALVLLLDLGQDIALREMAAVVMDKLFFTVAVHSFRGSFGSTHGGAHASILSDARIEPTACASWLLWGVGALNASVAAAVSLACSTEYEFPEIVGLVARDRPEEMWARERHTWDGEEDPGAISRPGEVNKVTYKTPDFMLCSAQDYRPGEAGRCEHVWQATLGPNAVVFVNHPACSNVRDVCYPNFWAGNRVLPRVAQWRDTLIAIYRLPVDDWMGFTHAYFPTKAFDEVALRGGWAFARKGGGAPADTERAAAYLALYASQGFELMTRGHAAYRELRSYGAHNVWLCQVGRAAVDGSFQAFQEKVLSTGVVVEDLAVCCASLRGQQLSFDWEGPLLVDGQVQSLSGFPHYDNPYCTSEIGDRSMAIRYGDWMLELDLGQPEP
jgi:hypothetical protein